MNKQGKKNNLNEKIKEGYNLRREGKYNAALKIFEDILKENPDNLVALNGKAYVKYSLGEYDEAKRLFEEVLNKEKDNLLALNGLGYVYAYQKKYKESIECFNKIIELNNNNNSCAYAYNGLGFVNSRKGEYKKAIEYFEKAWKKNKRFYESINLIYDYLKRRLNRNDLDYLFDNYILKIAFYILALKCNLIVVDKKIVYHYTKPSAVISMLTKNPYFRLHNSRYMNDPEEGKIFLNLVQNSDKLDYIKKIYENSNYEKIGNIQIFIGSFVVEGDDLYLWRTYGKDENGEEAKGLCIGLNKGFFNDIPSYFENANAKSEIDRDKSEDLNCLYYVIYYHKEDENFKKLEKILKCINDIVKKLFDNFRFDRRERKVIYDVIKIILNEIRYLVKSKHYKEEKECRVVKVIHLWKDRKKIHVDQRSFPPKLYVEINKNLRDFVKEIILGPRLEKSTEWGIYLKYINHQIEIKTSECKYK